MNPTQVERQGQILDNKRNRSEDEARASQINNQNLCATYLKFAYSELCHIWNFSGVLPTMVVAAVLCIQSIVKCNSQSTAATTTGKGRSAREILNVRNLMKLAALRLAARLHIRCLFPALSCSPVSDNGAILISIQWISKSRLSSSQARIQVPEAQ